MSQYTNRAYFISPSGKLVTQTFTYTQVKEEETISVTTPEVNVTRS